jgi:hypothetical protein
MDRSTATTATTASEEIDKMESNDEQNVYMPYDPARYVIVVNESDLAQTSTADDEQEEETEDDESTQDDRAADDSEADNDNDNDNDNDDDDDDDDDGDEDNGGDDEEPEDDPWNDLDRFTMIRPSRNFIGIPGRTNTMTSCEDDDEFAKAFSAMVNESYESRKFEQPRSKVNMAIPINLIRSGTGSNRSTRFTDNVDQQQSDASGGGGSSSSSTATKSDSQTAASEQPGVVRFQLLTKKGNKQMTQVLNLPSDCSLAKTRAEKTDKELEEQRELKRFVLQYGERESESDDPGLFGLQWQRLCSTRGVSDAPRNSHASELFPRGRDGKTNQRTRKFGQYGAGRGRPNERYCAICILVASVVG